MIRIDTNRIRKWDKIKEKHCRYFKELVQKELTNLEIKNDVYISKRKIPNKDEHKINYTLDRKDRINIEEIFGGTFDESKKEKSKFIIYNDTKIKNIICGEFDEIINLFKKYLLNNKIIERIFSYQNFCDNKGWNRHKLISMLEINVCPYCNRQYITNYEDGEDNSKKTTADLDHFYSQKDYPYLALSLYNFIPSCQICNSRFKIKEDFKKIPHIYPYTEEFGEHAKFKIRGNTIEYLLGESTNFEIYIYVKSSEYKEKIENSIITFHLDKVYKTHTDYIQEIIKKTIMYSDDKINELLLEFPDLFSSNDEVYRIVFGNYFNDEDFNKRPLSKLTKDICEDLGMNFI